VAAAARVSSTAHGRPPGFRVTDLIAIAVALAQIAWSVFVIVALVVAGGAWVIWVIWVLQQRRRFVAQLRDVEQFASGIDRTLQEAEKYVKQIQRDLGTLAAITDRQERRGTELLVSLEKSSRRYEQLINGLTTRAN
jgi:hypothetical protein